MLCGQKAKEATVSDGIMTVYVDARDSNGKPGKFPLPRCQPQIALNEWGENGPWVMQAVIILGL